MKRERGHWAPVCIVMAGAALVTVGSAVTFREQSFGMQSAGDPVVLRPVPGRQGRGASLPRGEVLLFQFLQHFADATGKKVCYGGDETPAAKIELPRAVKQLDATAAKEILRDAGYDLSNATYKGSDVHWVQRSISTKRKKGRIIRKGEERDQEETPAFKGPAGLRGEESLDLYVRDQGSGARYVVIFQTDSRDEAEDAVSLLEAHQRSKTEGTKGR